MFTIEHDFDATVITLIDEGDAPLREDVTIEAFEDCVVLEQLDPRTDEPMRLTLSMAQLRDLAAALNLPEGSYRMELSREDGQDETVAADAVPASGPSAGKPAKPVVPRSPKRGPKPPSGPEKPPADIA